MKYFTVVYAITDEVEWSKVNPLNYQHHGSKAVSCSIGDVIGYADALEPHVAAKTVQELQQEHMPS